MTNPNIAARRQQGFTLIETLISVAIAAILSSIAWPSYASYVGKAHRFEAKLALQQLMLQQEQWRNQHAEYASAAADLRAPTLARYRLSVRDASAAGYTLAATAIGPQMQDRACTVLLLSVQGGDVQYQHEGSAPAGQCWGKL